MIPKIPEKLDFWLRQKSNFSGILGIISRLMMISQFLVSCANCFDKYNSTKLEMKNKFFNFTNELSKGIQDAIQKRYTTDELIVKIMELAFEHLQDSAGLDNDISDLSGKIQNINPKYYYFVVKIL